MEPTSTEPPKPRRIIRDLNGDVIKNDSLPVPNLGRWLPNSKAILVRAIQAGLISREWVLTTYRVSDEEFVGWEKEFKILTAVHDLNGNVIAINDLPPADTRRWTPNKKAVLVRAVQGELISREELLARYNMEEAEFARWERELARIGANGLKVTKFNTNARKE
jgi:hypothetical protein